MRRRWLQIGLLALAIFLVNAVAHFVSWKAHINSDEGQTRLSTIGIVVIGLIVMAMSARYSIRYPFPRVVGDIGAAVLIGTLLLVLFGPYFGGTTPFADGVEFFIYEILLFVGVGALAIILGFVGAVAFGKDWKSRGLRRYEEHYSRRLHTTPTNKRRPARRT